MHHTFFYIEVLKIQLKTIITIINLFTSKKKSLQILIKDLILRL